MEVAPAMNCSYAVYTVYTVHTVYTIQLLYTARAVACMPIYIVALLEWADGILSKKW